MPKGDIKQLKADPEDGTTPVSHLLLEAVAVADLTGKEKGAILHLWRTTYGWKINGTRPKEKVISLSEWAKVLGTDPTRASKIIKNLSETKHILIRQFVGPGKGFAYSMNTRIYEWNHNSIDFERLLSLTNGNELQPLSSDTNGNELQPLSSDAQQPLSSVTIQPLSSVTIPDETNSLVPKEILKENIKKDITKEINKEKTVFVLPDWIKPETWDAYLEMRKKKRAPATELAKVLVVKELDKLRQRGFEPEAVLNQSILNTWTDVYEIKKKNRGDNGDGNGQSGQTGRVGTDSGNSTAIPGNKPAGAFAKYNKPIPEGEIHMS